MYFKVLSALWSISLSSKVMCWMVGWEKRRIKCHFLLSPDLQLLATKIIFYFAKGPLKLKYHKVQKTPESKRCSGILKGRK